jgi:hypothetical protein
MRYYEYFFRPAIVAQAFLLCVYFCQAQTKNYKQYDVCTASEIHKGKVNHGKSYCIAWTELVKEFYLN